MARRQFLLASGTGAAVFVVPGCAADSESPAVGNPRNEAWESQAAALEKKGMGLYTATDEKDQPGKGGSHVPLAAIAGNVVTISTTHKMVPIGADFPQGHYITHHYLRDEAGVIFAWKTYALGTDAEAKATFTLPAGTKTFTAYQVCNLHWTWKAAPQTA